jgi:predicted HicB family RNase H-like nuclease
MILHNQNNSILSDVEKKIEKENINNMYETLSNDYLKLKEKFEILQSSKKTEIEEIKLDYENKFEDFQKKFFIEMKKKEIDFIKEKEELNKRITVKKIKIVEYENQIKTLNHTLLNLKKQLSQFEKIIFKQEDSIDLLNKEISKNEILYLNTKNEMDEKESNNNKLLNIIKEQKIQIQNLINEKNSKENSEITRLKTEILTLKNTIEVKNESIKKIQKEHQLLQEKYLKNSIEKRLKTQKDLLQEARNMRIKKEGRNKNSVFYSIRLTKNKKFMTLNDISDNSILPQISRNKKSHSNKNMIKNYSTQNYHKKLYDEV